MYGKDCNLRTLSREYDCLANIGTKEVFTYVVTGKLGQTSKCNMRRLETIKDKICDKTHLLLRILGVIGRYGPNLMIVAIFVTQNNFKNGPEISDRLPRFYRPTPSPATKLYFFFNEMMEEEKEE